MDGEVEGYFGEGVLVVIVEMNNFFWCYRNEMLFIVFDVGRYVCWGGRCKDF